MTPSGLVRALFAPGNTLGLLAAVGGWFAVESYFNRTLLPFPAMPFKVAGVMTFFCAVKAMESLWDLVAAIRSSRRPKGLARGVPPRRTVGAA